MNDTQPPVDDLERYIDDLDRKQAGTRVHVEAMAELAAFRRYLRDRRTTLGLTQKDVAAAMGVSQAAVSQMESGADVTASKLARYMHVLGIRGWAVRAASVCAPESLALGRA